MLHGFLHGRRLIATATLVAWSVAVPLAGTARADDAQVTVVTAGGGQRPLSLDALAGREDVNGISYTLRSATGVSPQAVTGFSLAAILKAAEADPIGFSYLEVQRPAGGSVLLSRHQALDPEAFAEGSPAIYATAAGTGFLRPSTGPEDLNASDCFEAPQGIMLILRKGSPLRVRAKASSLRTRPGRPVKFAALVDRAGSGEQLSYSWYFDDGHSGSGATTSHSFAKRGSYDVVVGVTAPGDEAGASAVVTVQVGAPLAGPERKGGGRDHDAEAPDHGAASSPGTGTPGDRGTGSSSPGSPPAPAAKEPPHPAPVPSGDHVSGLLLSDSRPLAKPRHEPPAQAAARTGRLDGGGGGGLPAAAWGLLATAGLFGAGALAEARGGLSLAGAIRGSAAR